MANPPEQLIQRPGMRTLSATECLRRIESFINQCPGLTAVILLGRVGTTSPPACTHTTNIDRLRARDMLRQSVNDLDKAMKPPSVIGG